VTVDGELTRRAWGTATLSIQNRGWRTITIVGGNHACYKDGCIVNKDWPLTVGAYGSLVHQVKVKVNEKGPYELPVTIWTDDPDASEITLQLRGECLDAAPPAPATASK
jgi:hypothetical protein